MPRDDLPVLFEVDLHPILAFFDRMLVDVQPSRLIPYKGKVVIEVFNLHEAMLRKHDPCNVLVEMFDGGF